MPEFSSTNNILSLLDNMTQSHEVLRKLDGTEGFEVKWHQNQIQTVPTTVTPATEFIYMTIEKELKKPQNCIRSQQDIQNTVILDICHEFSRLPCSVDEDYIIFGFLSRWSKLQQ
jgi:hypothetical protein